VKEFAGAFDGQHATVVGEGMDHHGGVASGLDHFVQVADAAFAHGAGQGAVAPYGLPITQQVPPHQVGGGEVVVAGDRVQGQPEARGHVGDEAGLADAGGAFDEQGEAVLPGLLEDLHLVAGGFVEGNLGGHGGVHLRAIQ
jgi:hypothetical protein